MIVVTCECTQTYRLPDRYGGKRCRCRECGERITVPGEAQGQPEERRPRRRKKRRAAVTKRLGQPNERAIASDGAELRRALTSHRCRVSESLHQLAPLHSEGRDPTPRARSGRAAAEAAEKRRKGKARRAADGKGKGRSRGAKPKAGVGREDAPRAEDREAVGRARKPRRVARGRRRRRGGLAPAHLARTADLSTLARGPARGRRTRGAVEGDGERAARPGPARGPAIAVAAIAGLLFLAIGLAVGALATGDLTGPSLESEVAALDALAADGRWPELDAQLGDLERRGPSGEAALLGRLARHRATVQAMLAYRALPGDPEGRFTQAMALAEDASPAVRAGAALELRAFGDLDDAVDRLVELSEDPDVDVQRAAVRSLVHAGGLAAAPFLERAIRESAASGDPLGDVAIEQALRLEEPEATPALLAILDTRPTASAPLLARTLRLLAEVGEGRECAAAASRFVDHDAFDVQRAAEAVLEALG